MHGFLLGTVMREQTGVSGDEWALIGLLLQPERGRNYRPDSDNRFYFKVHAVDGSDKVATASLAERVWQVEQRVP